MPQLAGEGFLPNRARMIATSFLTRDLGWTGAAAPGVSRRWRLGRREAAALGYPPPTVLVGGVAA
ncbi:MAG: hypothetical protein ACYCU7_12775 [Acidimicrobiales bacterium]